MKYNQVSEEVIKYQEKLGQECGEIFYYIQQEVIEISYRLQEHIEIYGTNESRIHEVLEPSASSFFGLLYDLMLNDLLIKIARLGDPKETRIKKETLKNISVKGLLDIKTDDDCFNLGLKVKIEEFLEFLEPIKEMRNKYLAHMDYKFSLSLEQNLQNSIVNREMIKNCLTKLIEILDLIEMKFYNLKGEYEVIVQGGASNLLWTLYEGLRFYKNRQIRLNLGLELGEYEDEKRNPISPEQIKDFGI